MIKLYIIDLLKWALSLFEDKVPAVEPRPVPEEPVKKKPTVKKATTRTKKPAVVAKTTRTKKAK